MRFTLTPEVRRLALQFLLKAGSDCVGIIDSDDKAAAALVYEELKCEGMVISRIGDDGPVYRLTPKGARHGQQH